jgi:hypothetical protein
MTGSSQVEFCQAGSIPYSDLFPRVIDFWDLKAPDFTLITVKFLHVDFGPAILPGKRALDHQSTISKQLVLSRFGWTSLLCLHPSFWENY